MDLTRIIAITGKPGLFELASQTKGGFIVKDLVTQKKLSINANSQVSLLQNISIYTIETEVSLISVLVNISKKYSCKEINFSKNDPQSLRKMMAEIQPDYAEDKVYDSDLKKLFNWYNILIKNNIITEESIQTYENSLKETEEKVGAENEEDKKTSQKKETSKTKSNKNKTEE
ncbi:DUF5606 family protein [Apibacter adventoris]|uniref:DUF5606 family protein n=1 Tax=Apibacter adventoris TaxID=1679466 RepID=UPI0015E48EF5|nr:DUF5606 domain-containing protein [Apibacter adventoris]